MLDLSRLRYFQAVAEAGSFSRAARGLGLSQPTLSVQIARLEEELGTTLLRRHRSGVTPTPAGQRLLAHAEELFHRVDRLEQELRTQASEPEGPLRIGTIGSVGTYLLPDVLDLFTQRYPRVRPTILFEHSDPALDLLQQGRLDIALTARARPPTAAHNVPLFDDPLLLVVGPGHRLWGRRFVRPRDIEGERLIGMAESSPSARLVEHVLARHKVRLQPVIRSTQMPALVRLVRINLGLAFLPRMAVSEDLAAGRLHAVSFEGEELHRKIWASWDSPDPIPARDAFVSILKEVTGSLALARKLP